MHLTDCFMELVAYVAYFQRTAAARQPPFEQVKADVQRLLSRSESTARKGGFAPEDFDLARFAVCAWVDEAILASGWTHRSLWQREQLQRLFYNTTDAGEEFFEKLNALGFHQKDAREVYYLCLSLGFLGRYCNPGDEFLLDQLRTSNLKLLLGSSVGVPSLDRGELFPDAYPAVSAEAGPGPAKARFSTLALVGLAAPVVLFGILYVIYRFSLSGIGENFLKTVPY
ncbi:MAG: DotU family type IV/VI secretion system protein [Deltaproteobacteria bacterium]|nr:DotU family type IV/VI secretion system protein [Deltaproteobacteria bacterium]